MTSKDEYGFITYVSSSRCAKPGHPPPTEWVVATQPDPRRFAIALPGPPGETNLVHSATYYNPLLRNPGSRSEYLAGLRSVACSGGDYSVGKTSPVLADAAKVAHLFGRRDSSVVPTVSASVQTKTTQADRKTEATKQQLQFQWHFGQRNLNAFCFLVSVLLVLCVATALLLFFTVGQGDALVAPGNLPANIVEGEFDIVNETISDDLSLANSSVFVKLAARIQRNLDHVFASSALLRGLYNRTEVRGIVPSNDLRRPAIRIRFRTHLTGKDPAAVEKLSLVLRANLNSSDSRRLLDSLPIDLDSISFTEADQVLADPVTPPGAFANWGPWSSWTSCPTEGCSHTQRRHRSCYLVLPSNGSVPLADLAPCLIGSTASIADTQVQKCPCATKSRPADAGAHRGRVPFNVIRTTKNPRVKLDGHSIGTVVRSCAECRAPAEVCVARVDEVIPVCRWAPDPEDATGCGGFCRINTELCVRLGNNTFRCEEDYGCSASEWRCNNGLCIAATKRCDGHFNCYDHSDEFDCDCEDGKIRCGNETSCIDAKKRCDGNVDCWDASDESNCSIPCPDGQFTCTNGDCVAQTRFCDGFADCSDATDEPAGCGGSCRSTERRCKNGRCVKAFTYCDGFDSCGDNSDEENCPTTDEPGTAATNGSFTASSSEAVASLAQPLAHNPLDQGCDAELEFTCASGDCVPIHCLCNSANDCGDFSDEYRCPETI